MENLRICQAQRHLVTFADIEDDYKASPVRIVLICIPLLHVEVDLGREGATWKPVAGVLLPTFHFTRITLDDRLWGFLILRA